MHAACIGSHDALHSTVFAVVDVCLSVCLSHACIVSKRLAKLKLFRPSDSSIILVFGPLRRTQFQGEPRQLRR